MSNKKRNDFLIGYACACADIMRSHGEDTIAADVFRGCFMTVSQMRKVGVDESDIDALKPIVKEILRKRKL